MIVLTAFFQVKKGKEKEFEQAFEAVFPLVRSEPGAVTYFLHRSTEEPGKFFLYEQYRDRDALDYHGKTPHFADLTKKVRDLVTSPPALELYEERGGIRP